MGSILLILAGLAAAAYFSKSASSSQKDKELSKLVENYAFPATGTAPGIYSQTYVPVLSTEVKSSDTILITPEISQPVPVATVTNTPIENSSSPVQTVTITAPNSSGTGLVSASIPIAEITFDLLNVSAVQASVSNDKETGAAIIAKFFNISEVMTAYNDLVKRYNTANLFYWLAKAPQMVNTAYKSLAIGQQGLIVRADLETWSNLDQYGTWRIYLDNGQDWGWTGRYLLDYRLPELQSKLDGIVAEARAYGYTGS